MGTSAIVVPVMEADPAFKPFRTQHTKDGAEGHPAHVTLWYEFLPTGELTDECISRVGAVLQQFEPFAFSLTEFGYLDLTPPLNPRVLYALPNPIEPFQEMSRALEAKFPGVETWQGYKGMVHHSTIAQADEGTLDAIKEELADVLPVKSHADEVWLMVHEHDSWTQKHSFAL